MVRNSHHQGREVSTAAGAVSCGRRGSTTSASMCRPGERRRFASSILPVWARKSPQVGEVLPLLYLHGMSRVTLCSALEQFLGSAAGLSASTVTRLTGQWQDDAETFNKRPLKETDYVYCWVDGIHLKTVVRRGRSKTDGTDTRRHSDGTAGYSRSRGVFRCP